LTIVRIYFLTIVDATVNILFIDVDQTSVWLKVFAPYVYVLYNESDTNCIKKPSILEVYPAKISMKFEKFV